MLAFFAVAPNYHIHILSSHETGTAGIEPASIPDLFHCALPLSYVPNRKGRNRTLIFGFGDHCSTIELPTYARLKVSRGDRTSPLLARTWDWHCAMPSSEFGIICSLLRLPVRLVKPLGHIRKCSIRQLVVFPTVRQSPRCTRGCCGRGCAPRMMRFISSCTV